MRREYTVEDEGVETAVGMQLKETVLQRAPLLLTDSGGKQHKTVRSGAGKLLTREKLLVRATRGIRCKLTFRNVTKVQAVTCCARGNITLLITEPFDMFDVSNALGATLFSRCRLEDALLMATILETPLDALKARGFPVHRLHIDEPKSSRGRDAAKTNIIAPDTGLPKPRTEQNPPPPPPKLADESSKLEGFAEILQSMFPNVDPNYIRKLLKEQTGDHLRKVAEHLADEAHSKPQQKDETTGKTPTNEPPKPTKKSGLGKVGSAFWKALSSSASAGAGASRQKATNNGNVGGLQGPSGDHGQQPADSAGAPPTRSQIAQSLRRAVALSGPQRDDHIQSSTTSIPRSPAAETSCEVIPGQDLALVKPPQHASRSCLRVFRNRSLSPDQVLQQWESCEKFSTLLRGLGTEVFKVNASALCIFYDPGGRTVAFNSSNNHAIHFNLAYFISLAHERELASSKQPYVYWYLVFCHELAHK